MEPKLLVQSLTGLKAQILWAFFFAGKGMGIKELMNWTSRPRNAHSGPLNALCAAQLLERRKMPHGEDWFCLGHDVLPMLQDMVKQLGGGLYLQEPIKLLEGQLSENPTPESTDGVARSPEELDALNAAMTDHGILGRKRNELLASAWVTAEYVRAMVEFEKGERQPEYAVGRAINKMLAHFAQPARRSNGHMENCHCSKCNLEEALGRSEYLCQDCHQYPCSCEDEITEVDDVQEVS